MIEEVRIKDEFFSRSQALSIGLHISILGLLLIPFAHQFNHRFAPPGFVPLLGPAQAPPPKVLQKLMAPPGGGGQNDKGPATRGAIRFRWVPLVPLGPARPAILKVVPSVTGPPEFQIPIDADRWGDPNAPNFTRYWGRGKKGGVGDGVGPGVGPNKGDGWSDESGGRRAGYTDPTCSYCPNPTFTEEAIKAKFQGRVLLRVSVTAEGNAERVQVVAGAGMGLDERALEAVRGWRFRPGRDPAGKTTATTVYIDVHFRQF